MKKTLGLLLLLVLAAMTWLYAAATGWLESDEVDGQMAQTPRSVDVGGKEDGNSPRVRV